MDVVTLSRIQFGINISFHYIFPPLSIGLGLILVIMEGLYLATKNEQYRELTRFWVKIFALIFAIGVATGLVMVFAFGTNFANFSWFVGDVFGSLLGAEGIFAFFLEAGFLGIMLFGWDRVGPKMHFLSTCLVAFGAHFSAIWIVVANSWMQTPAGYKIVGEGVDRKAVLVDFWQAVFNPSSLDRLAHVILGCWLAGAFLVVSVHAYYLLKNRHQELAWRGLKIALSVATLSVFLQLFSGDSTARCVARNQPIKLAAFEGVYKTEEATPMYLFGWVNTKERKVDGVAIPGGLSLLTNHSWSEPVKGLDLYPKELWPRVGLVFQTYHGMIAMWGLMFVAVVWAYFAIWRGRLHASRALLRYLSIAVLFPQVANQLGWYSAEFGRQPWAVYGLQTTQEAATDIITAGQVIGSIVMFSLIYALIFILFIYLLNKKIQHGFDPALEIVEYRGK